MVIFYVDLFPFLCIGFINNILKSSGREEIMRKIDNSLTNIFIFHLSIFTIISSNWGDESSLNALIAFMIASWFIKLNLWKKTCALFNFDWLVNIYIYVEVRRWGL